jgi:predicted RNA methylase
MAKISRDLLRRHDAACALLALDRPLDVDEIHQILDDWHEGAAHANSRMGAHFTPKGLARDLACEIAGRRVVDLCSGIGMLSYMAWQHAHAWARTDTEGQENYTLVEFNPDYAAVARRLMPGAEVIVGSVFDPVLIAELRSRDFDVAISNPPYGRFNAANGRGPRYTGSDCHYAVIDVASEIAKSGVFLIPQTATPFRYSGCQSYSEVPTSQVAGYERFRDETGIEFAFNCGIDTSGYKSDWRDVSITVEIVLADFVEAAARRKGKADAADQAAAEPKPANQFSLFDIAA